MLTQNFTPDFCLPWVYSDEIIFVSLRRIICIISQSMTFPPTQNAVGGKNKDLHFDSMKYDLFCLFASSEYQ